MPHNDQQPSSSALDPEELRAVAVDIAGAAARLIRTRRPEIFGAPGDRHDAADSAAVHAKSSRTDPVTIVDTEAEQLIRSLLGKHRPGDAVFGEEGGGALAVAGEVRWVVDPIDGTVNFLYGIPAYSVSVAAQIDGQSVAGAVVDVANGVTYCAAAGHGASRIARDGTETPLRCSAVDEVAMALVATGFGYGAARRTAQGRLLAQLLPRVRDIRRIGSAALDLCMVASGLVDVHYEHGLSPWDWAAGALVAREAGARVRLPAATALSTAGELIVASAPGIADEFDGVLDEIGALAAIPES